MHFLSSTRLPEGSNTARCLLLPRLTLNQPYDCVLLEAYRVWYHSNRLKALRGKIRHFFRLFASARRTDCRKLASWAPVLANVLFNDIHKANTIIFITIAYHEYDYTMYNQHPQHTDYNNSLAIPRGWQL